MNWTLSFATKWIQGCYSLFFQEVFIKHQLIASRLCVYVCVCIDLLSIEAGFHEGET